MMESKFQHALIIPNGLKHISEQVICFVLFRVIVIYNSAHITFMVRDLQPRHMRREHACGVYIEPFHLTRFHF